MAQMQDLPNEILGKIFAFTIPPVAPEDDDELGAAQTKSESSKMKDEAQKFEEWCEVLDILPNLCLVSRRFRDLAQPLLFDRFFDDGTSTEDLSMLLKFTKAVYLRPDLGERVKQVTVYPVTDVFDWNTDVSAEDVAFFTPIIEGFTLSPPEVEDWFLAMQKNDLSVFIALLVNKTPNLRELVLPADTFFMSPVTQLMTRNLSLLNKLERVWLKGDSRNFSGYTINDFKEFFTLPKMKRPIVEYGNLTSSGYPDTWTAGSLAAENVAFIDCHMDASSLSKFTGACKRLTDFTFRSWYADPNRVRDTRAADHKLFTAPQALDALRAHKATLQTVHIEFPRTLQEVESADAVQEYIGRTDKIGHMRDFVALEALLIPHAMLPPKPEFPPNIQEIHIADCNSSIRDQVAHLAAAVKRNKYPALKDVIFTAVDVSRPLKLAGQHVPPGKTPYDMMKSLKDLFNGTNVEFNIQPVAMDEPDDYDSDDDLGGNIPLSALGGLPGGPGGGPPPGPPEPDGRPPMPPAFMEYFLARARQDPDFAHLFRD